MNNDDTPSSTHNLNDSSAVIRSTIAPLSNEEYLLLELRSYPELYVLLCEYRCTKKERSQQISLYRNGSMAGELQLAAGEEAMFKLRETGIHQLQNKQRILIEFEITQ